MKTKLLSILLFGAVFLASFLPAKAVVKTIYNVNDSGAFIYLVQVTNVTLTARIDKEGTQVYTQQNTLKIKEAGGVIYQINYVNDSLLVGGLKPTSLANAAAKVGAMLKGKYQNYRSAVTTVALIKTGSGFLHTITLDSVGVGGKLTLTVWDGTGAADTTSAAVPLWSGPITSPIATVFKDVKFTKGLYIKQKVTTAGRVSFSYYFLEPEDGLYLSASKPTYR